MKNPETPGKIKKQPKDYKIIRQTKNIPKPRKTKKNTAHRRHRIPRCVQIVAQIEEKKKWSPVTYVYVQPLEALLPGDLDGTTSRHPDGRTL